MVYAYRDAGFDCHGFDIHDRLALRAQEDRRYFSILEAATERRWDQRVDWSEFRLPYENERFEFVFSTEVFEHVLNHGAVLKEIARVLKRGGGSIHSFPAKYRLIEPHMKVPGGALFKSTPYFLPWAILGVRSDHQRRWSVLETAVFNAEYARAGLNYVSPWRLNRLGRELFSISEFVPELWEFGGPSERSLAGSSIARAYYTMTKHVIWLLANPKRSDVSGPATC